MYYPYIFIKNTIFFNFMILKNIYIFRTFQTIFNILYMLFISTLLDDFISIEKFRNYPPT